jgi:nonribosomal peptide synthetase protein BlmIV
MRLTELARPRFERLETRLAAGDMARLREAGSARNLTPSGLLCAGYAEVLAMWSQTGRFTINLTTFNRLPLHPDIDSVVGDFTSTTLLSVDATANTFTARAQAIQQQIFRDLEHREFGGVDVLRLIRSDPRRREDALAPVVFTSTLLPAAGPGGPAMPAAPSWPARVAYSVSQTPQVLLDSAQRGGHLEGGSRLPGARAPRFDLQLRAGGGERRRHPVHQGRRRRAPAA